MKISHKLTIFLIILFVAFIAIFPAVSLAQTEAQLCDSNSLFFDRDACCDQYPSSLACLPGIDLTTGDVYCIFLRVMTWLFSFALVLAIMFIIINGTRYFFTGGDPSAITKTTQNLTWTIVGVVVVLLSMSILLAIANFLGVFTAEAEIFLIPVEAQMCDVVWWVDMIQGVFDLFK